jgi:sugar-specific transcriptional regulator TrmB
MENKDFLEIFGLKAIPKKVLLDLIKHGVSKVTDISSRLHLPKSTIYDALALLSDKSLINEYSDERGKSFGLSDNEQLARVHSDKIEEFKKAHSSLLSFINSHSKEESVVKPKIKFYSGTVGIKQAFRDMMWNSKYKEAYLMWPMQDMLDSIDEDFLKWHGTRRYKHGVMIYSIEKHSDRKLQTKEHEWLENDIKNKLTEVRYLPKGMNWKMSYWIYGDKCLFASGGKEKVAFTIHSQEFCDIMKLMWDQMWEVARR